jgi:hypothetical protein
VKVRVKVWVSEQLAGVGLPCPALEYLSGGSAAPEKVLREISLPLRDGSNYFGVSDTAEGDKVSENFVEPQIFIRERKREGWRTTVGALDLEDPG